ncbi:neuronal acetylcholine receptor subunit alpha-7-like isoform X1 [Amphiura filiformis]|uniref:neuronal acetylcholine receptor subunit alpha-7-like isoform X1 n=1 Tax=Amphiura filiformis TaxID=82378 RepID=UPI003B219353
MLITCSILWYLVVTTFSAIQATNPKGLHSILTKELLSDYGPTSARPVSDVNKRINVEIDLEVLRVINLNEREQTLQQSTFIAMIWHDDYLTWNTSAYPDVNVLILPTDQIWRPDIHLFENVDRNFESLKDVGAWVSPDGTVFWATPAILYTACRIDARLFPFDTQHCTLRFGSWSYDEDHLNLTPMNNSNGIGKYFIENGVWHLEDVQVKNVVNVYPEGTFPEVVYTILLRRRPLFHVFSFSLPCGLLSLLNLLAFILPTESGEKVSLGITNLLALVLFQQLIGDSLPPSSTDMPIISYYFTPMILIGCLSIVSGVLVAALYHQDKTNPVPQWLLNLTRVRPGVHLPTNTAHLQPEWQNVSDEVKKSPDSTENGIRRNNSTSNGHGISVLAYPVHEERGVFTDDHLRSRIDYSSDWRKVASVIDKLILIFGVVITIAAIIITAILFATSEEVHNI